MVFQDAKAMLADNSDFGGRQSKAQQTLLLQLLLKHNADHLYVMLNLE